MARGRRSGVLIAGGGIAGCLAALAMARLRPEVPLLIVEEKDRFGGAGFHPWFDAELEGAESLVMPLASTRWPGFYVAFEDFSRKLKEPCGGIEGAALHRAMIDHLAPEQYRLGVKVVAVKEDALILDGGEEIRAEGA
ncbi:MAG: lycopene cyclase family protein, partial [Sphingomonas sp.]